MPGQLLVKLAALILASGGLNSVGDRHFISHSSQIFFCDLYSHCAQCLPVDKSYDIGKHMHFLTEV